MIVNLKSHLNTCNSIPVNGARIEVFFSVPKMWYRGTYLLDRGKHLLNYDDGDERYVEDWSEITWRVAKSKKNRKNGLIN
jgi:hypothetical protein